MGRKSPVYGPMILAVLLFSVFLFLPANYFAFLINDQTLEITAPLIKKEKEKGLLLQEAAFQRSDYLPIYGSSELGSASQSSTDLAYHTTTIFARKPTGFETYLIGEAGYQSFIHLIDFAALGDTLRNKKVVFVLSPQWFSKTGLSQSYVDKNLSFLQTYEFVYSTSIDPSLKQKIAQRMLQFTTIKTDPVLYRLVVDLANKGANHRASLFDHVQGYVTKAMLEKQDMLDTIGLIKKNENNKLAVNTKPLNWDQLRTDAVNDASKVSRNNPYYILDKYYDNSLKVNADKLRGSQSKSSFDTSPEYDDLDLLLRYFKEMRVDAAFVSVPVNGYWYDYTGFPKDDRAAYYAKVRQQIQSYGFKVIDLSDKEYVPFTLFDPTHLGWRGWVDVDEAINEFYHGNLH